MFAFILQFFYLGKIPAGFSSDEASLGYNTYSILKTGKDEYGINLPLSFKAFGEYKAPLYIYFSVPVIAIFDLSTFSARLPSAMLGIFNISVVFLIAKIIFKRFDVGLLSALIFSILPWNIQFSRISYEGNLVLLLLSLGFLFFIYGIKRNLKFFVLSAIFFSLSIYSHYTVRLFVPLFILSLFLIYRKYIILYLRNILFSFIIGILIIIPLAPSIFSSSGLSRVNYISFPSDKGSEYAINEKIAEHIWSEHKNGFSPRIIHNKLSEYFKRFASNYIAHFDLSYLLLTGDESYFFKTPNSGVLLFSFIPFLFIGIVELLRKQNLESIALLSWLFLSPMSSSLTRLGPSSNRTFMIILSLTIIISVGIIKLWQIIKVYKLKIFFYIFIVIFIFEYVFYLDNYYIHQYVNYASETQNQGEEVVKSVNQLDNKYNYQLIWVTPKYPGYIHFLFHLKYPPALYQTKDRLGPLDEYGFGWVNGFDKYAFERIPKYYDFSQKNLYVLTSGELPPNVIPFQQLFYPDGQEAYLFIDTSTIQKYCPECSLKYKPKNMNIYGEIINPQ